MTVHPCVRGDDNHSQHPPPELRDGPGGHDGSWSARFIRACGEATSSRASTPGRIPVHPRARGRVGDRTARHDHDLTRAGRNTPRAFSRNPSIATCKRAVHPIVHRGTNGSSTLGGERRVSPVRRRSRGRSIRTRAARPVSCGTTSMVRRSIRVRHSGTVHRAVAALALPCPAAHPRTREIDELQDPRGLGGWRSIRAHAGQKAEESRASAGAPCTRDHPHARTYSRPRALSRRHRRTIAPGGTRVTCDAGHLGHSIAEGTGYASDGGYGSSARARTRRDVTAATTTTTVHPCTHGHGQKGRERTTNSTPR